MTYPLDEWNKTIKEKGILFGYFDSVKDFNKEYPAVDSDDI